MSIKSGIYAYNDEFEVESVVMIVLKFYIGCYSLESVLPSTMQCFYDGNPCIDQISDIVHYNLPINFTRFNSSQTSLFPTDVTVENPLGNLFVDRILTDVNLRNRSTKNNLHDFISCYSFLQLSFIFFTHHLLIVQMKSSCQYLQLRV